MPSCTPCSLSCLTPQFNDSYDPNIEASMEKKMQLVHILFIITGIVLIISAVLVLVFLIGNVGAVFSAFGITAAGMILISIGSCSLSKARVIIVANRRLTDQKAQLKSPEKPIPITSTINPNLTTSAITSAT